MAEFETEMVFGDMTLRLNSEIHRAHGGLWLQNSDGEGIRIEPNDEVFGELLRNYFDENF